MVDRIAEVLENGTVYCFDMDKCIEEADTTLEQLHTKEGVEIDFDFTAVVFSLFIRSIQILTNSGWSTEDLIEEILEHSEADDNIDEDFED